MSERLQKVIAESGYTSRRKAEELISKGCVKVNGEVVKTLGTKVNSDDIISVNGNVISRDEKVYFLLNKPRNTVCTVSDELDRKTVIDLIETDKRIFPVGRLDYDTTGALILTNDGNLTNILTHPNSEVPKTYLVKLDRLIDIKDFYKIKEGISVDSTVVDVTYIKIKKQDKTKNVSFIELTIHEGRNHIVKKLFKTLGYNVDKLTRTYYAFLNVNDLKSGEYRTLTKKEVKDLYKYGK